MLISRLFVVVASLLVSSALAGCGGEEDHLDVTVTREGTVPVFQWTGAAVNHISVLHCKLMCSTLKCSHGVIEGFGTALDDWNIDADITMAADLGSPLKYGILPDGTVDPNAVDLTVGTQYGVEIALMGACDPADPRCSMATASGCGTFVF